mmetsp:Transcript_7224/g.15002  ORF Transcript_7224/g.15002 Transcript_7224/m.15002 type:complete len:138 (+) Transcript_7224:465-878(+)
MGICYFDDGRVPSSSIQRENSLSSAIPSPYSKQSEPPKSCPAKADSVFTAPTSLSFSYNATLSITPSSLPLFAASISVAPASFIPRSRQRKTATGIKIARKRSEREIRSQTELQAHVGIEGQRQIDDRFEAKETAPV